RRRLFSALPSCSLDFNDLLRHHLNRYVTDEQRSRRPIFIATLWAGASWPFFRVARSTRMTHIRALRSRLEKQPTDFRQKACYFGDRTLVEVLCQSWADTNRRALFLIGLSLLFAALAISELP